MPCAIILGGPRSGSSTLSGVVHHLGYPAAICDADLLPPAPMNPKGFYEDSKFYQLHRQMLGFDSNGDDQWTDPVPPQGGVAEAVLKNYQAHVQNRIAASNCWSVKDPRICFLFPILEKALLAAGENFKVLVVHRAVDQVIASLQRLGHSKEEATKTAWLYTGARRVIELHLSQSTTTPVLVMETNELVVSESRQQAISRIAEFLEVDVTTAALEFPDVTLRHFR